MARPNVTITGATGSLDPADLPMQVTINVHNAAPLPTPEPAAGAAGPLPGTVEADLDALYASLYPSTKEHH